MFFLDHAQSLGLLEERGFTFDELVEVMRGGALPKQAEVIPLENERFSGFLQAKRALEHFGDFTSCMLYQHSMGRRPSLENRHLYDRLRASYGERRPVFIAPGMYFEAHHNNDLVSFLELTINYCFEAVLVQHSSRNWVAFTGAHELILIKNE